MAGCVRSCERTLADYSPEEIVEQYLNVALNMESVIERQRLLALTTGALYEAIEGATEDELQEAYLSRKYQLESFYIKERDDLTPRETKITFVLKYKEAGVEESDFSQRKTRH